MLVSFEEKVQIATRTRNTEFWNMRDVASGRASAKSLGAFAVREQPDRHGYLHVGYAGDSVVPSQCVLLVPPYQPHGLSSVSISALGTHPCLLGTRSVCIDVEICPTPRCGPQDHPLCLGT